jgi:predicted nucleotidyltransferase
MSLKKRQQKGNVKMVLKKRESKAVDEFVSLVVQRMSGRVMELTLFGSRARGDYRRNSDIDVLVLINRESLKNWEIIQSLSAFVSLKFDVILSALVMDSKRYETHSQLRTLLFKNISQDGITLWKRKQIRK